MSADKFDKGKPPVGLIPRTAVLAEAEVLAFGAQKYARDNWRKGMDWTRLSDAALRHILAWVDGEDRDGETGISHLAHARCCLGFLLEYEKFDIGTDDRYTSSAAHDLAEVLANG